MNLTRVITGAAIAAAMSATAFANEPAKQGISATEVTFAQVAALDGPAGALGTGMRQGILAAFEEVNAKGGVHGRMLRLVSMDDGYEPDRSANSVREVIAGDAHIGFIGPVGTPTTKATQPIASEAAMRN